MPADHEIRGAGVGAAMCVNTGLACATSQRGGEWCREGWRRCREITHKQRPDGLEHFGSLIAEVKIRVIQDTWQRT